MSTTRLHSITTIIQLLYSKKKNYIVKAKLMRQSAIWVKIGREIISMIRFADDLVIIADNEDVELVLCELSTKWKRRLKHSKWKLMKRSQR